MSEPQIMNRNDVASQYKWNAESVYPNEAAWNQAADVFPVLVKQMEQFAGKLAESPKILLQALNALDAAYAELGKLFVYASISHEVDTTRTDATRMLGKANGLMGQFGAAAAYLDPEIMQIGLAKLQDWMAAEPGLKIYSHYFENLYRKQAHVRSAEVEEVLGSLAAPFQSTGITASLLTDADFTFKPALTMDGKEMPVSQGTLEKILTSADREARRTAWENYMDTYLSFKNTLANNLNTAIQQNVFNARSRRYASVLEATLFQNNIPVEVFHNLIDTYRRFLPIWHRYWAVRRKALGVEKLYPYDVWAPLTTKAPAVPYAQAVEWICAGLAPMGEDYVRTLRKGVLEERWIDVFPTAGKSSTQFSSGVSGTHPFIVIHYDDTLGALSTLAHELGHSMHSYHTWQAQPIIYSDYSSFVAEVASNFHQAMVRAHLFQTQTDADFQISIIEEAMDNFHRYFFIMPTLARFELEMHQRAERGEGLSADDMIACCADLFAEGYGSEMSFDRQRTGITWATFPHLYQCYYTFQYATGISGANALSRRVLSGTPGAASQYTSFLRAGSSLYPIDALKLAGVNLTTPQPVEETYAILEGFVNRLEELVKLR
jgi:oligoendopeptidase F